MVATSGRRLLKPDAMRALIERLLPLATLITPNISEAEVLSGRKVREPEDMRAAARSLHAQFRCAVLVKGGHLPAANVAVDLFYDGKTELLIDAPRARRIATHGTGCTYSAAIAALLARGRPLERAIVEAKAVITASIHRSIRAGPFTVLNPLGRTTRRG
jgi:hydroxymethylpyrimidine/phosphomethylpyrimidine kinase